MVIGKKKIRTKVEKLRDIIPIGKNEIYNRNVH